MSDLATWIRAAGIRSLKTFAQALLATITVAGATAGLGDIDWLAALSIAALAAIASLLTSCAGIPEADGGTDLDHITNPADVSYEDTTPDDDTERCDPEHADSE